MPATPATLAPTVRQTVRELPTVDQVAANLRTVRQSATADQVAEGTVWYRDMGAFIRSVRDDAADATGDYGVSDAHAVGTFAALSQNQSWAGNVTLATRYLRGEGMGGLGSVMRELECLEDDADPTCYGFMGLKRADFCANLLGDESRVTCDRWHLRAAFALAQYNADDLASMPAYVGRGRTKKTAPWIAQVDLTLEVWRLVTAATKIVAAEYGETPAQCQAVIWCAVRPSGDGK